MTIAFDGPGGIFTRLGHLAGLINAVNAYRSATTDGYVTTVRDDYAADDAVVVDGVIAARDAYRTAHGSWLQTLRQMAVSAAVEQVDRDTPLAARTLEPALRELIAQMAAEGETLDEPTVSVTVTAGGANHGDTALVASLVDGDGDACLYAFPETLTATVTSDAGRGATRYAEPVQVVGLPAVDDLDFRWPQGSGTSAALAVADAARDTRVTNGDFANWPNPAAPPAGWTVGVGTAGTTVVRSTVAHRDQYALAFAGNGSELTGVYQAVSLRPNTVYCVSYWARRSASLAAGVLRVRLTDGAGATISDDASAPNAASVTLSSGTSTSYAHQHAFFRTPRVLPDAQRLVVELTTAVTNGEAVYLDLVALTEAAQLYPGGPFVAAFSGATQAARGDTWDVAVANDGGVTKFVPMLDRLFGVRRLGLKFPVSSSGTIDDALITI